MTAKKVKNRKFTIVFHPSSRKPKESEVGSGECVLYNQCDGYHLAFPRFNEDGSFRGFYEFMGPEFQEDFYCAWAALPPSVTSLFDPFALKKAATP